MNKKSDFFKRHPLALHLLIMLGVSIVVIVIIMASLRLFTRHGREYELADFRGMTLDEAQDKSDIKLDFIVMDSFYVEGTPGGQIISQDPEPGQMVKSGRKVYVTVSTHSECDATMPDVVSKSLISALSQLENAGLTCGMLTFVTNPNPTAGLKSEVLRATVNYRSVAAGQVVKHGAMVDLEIGLNESERRQQVVPQVLGKDPRQARKLIHERSLNVGVETFDPDVKDRYHARVYKQEPEFTGLIPYALGTTVNLWYKNMDDNEAEQIRRDYQVDTAEVKAYQQELQDSMSSAVMDELQDYYEY